MTCESGEEGNAFASMAREILARYRSGDVPFHRLVDSLYSIISGFEESEWLEEVRGSWWILEQVYAVDLDRGTLNDMSMQSLDLIDEAVSELERLLAREEERGA